MREVLSLLFQLGGLLFIFAAMFGLIRFADPLQRIHASTKSGTLGAGLILVGAMIQMGGWDVFFIGLATLVFLLLTIPVAGHLLGRAAYICGVPLPGMHGDDALNGVLERSPKPLDEILEQQDDPSRPH